jgi:hypothetical protein
VAKKKGNLTLSMLKTRCLVQKTYYLLISLCALKEVTFTSFKVFVTLYNGALKQDKKCVGLKESRHRKG